MKKLYIILYMIILIPLVYSLDECERELETFDIPCRVTSTWDYPNACNTYEVTIYNNNGTALNTISLDTFGIYCNFTFNYSDEGTYYYNVSSGDTGSILVKKDMEMIYRYLVYGGYLLVVLVLIGFMHLFKQDKGTPMVYGTIASALSFIMTAVLISGFNIFYGVTFIVNVNYYLIGLTASIGIYTGMVAWTFYGDLRQERNPQY